MVLKTRPVIYTAVFGKKFELEDPQWPSPNCDYVCFIDNPELRSSVYDLRVVKPVFPDDDERSAKFYKILTQNFFPDHEIALWIDASRRIITPNIDDFIINHLKRGDFWLFPNTKRKTVREEIDYCIRNNKDDPDILEKQYKAYIDDGFPDDLGLHNNGVILKRIHNHKIVELSKLWWEELLKHSKRDEVSLPYILWKTGMKVNHFEGTITKNKYIIDTRSIADQVA